MYNKSVQTIDLSKDDAFDLINRDTSIVKNVDCYLEHIVELRDAWRAEVKNLPRARQSNVLMNCDDILRTSPKMLAGRLPIAKFIHYKMAGLPLPGVLHTTQIETAVDIISNVAHTPEKPIACIGATQCGKTGTSNATHFTGPVIFLMSQGEIRYYPITCLTQRLGHANQSLDEFDIFCGLYGDILFQMGSLPQQSLLSYTQNVVNLKSAQQALSFINDNYGNSLNMYHTSITIGRVRDHVESVFNSTVDGDYWRQLMLTRNISKCKRLSDLARAARDDGFSIMLIIDEPHFGDNVDGVQSKQIVGGLGVKKLEDFTRERAEEKKNTDQMLNNLRANLQSTFKYHTFVAYDATPFTLSGLENINTTRHRLSKDYCGLNMFDGEVLDPRVETIPPTLMTFQEIGERLHIKNLGIIKRANYTSLTSFLSWQRKTGYAYDHATYRRQCLDAFRDVIRKKLFNDPEDPKGLREGICIRWLKANANIDEFVKELKLDKRIVHIQYYGQNAKKSVSKTIKMYMKDKPGCKYVIWVTGAGRMADSFPGGCNYYLDFTEEMVNVISLMQGTFGRSTGYGKFVDGKAPTVIMHPINVEALNAYIKSKGLIRKDSNRVIRVGGRQSSSTVWHLHIGYSEHAFCNSLLDSLQKAIVSKLPYTQDADLPTASKLMRNTNRSDLFPFWEIFNNLAITKLEEEFEKYFPKLTKRPEFLTVGKVSKNADGQLVYIDYDPTEPNFGRISFRNAESRTGKDTSSRTRELSTSSPRTYSSTKVKGKNVKAYMPILWVKANHRLKKWEIVGVVLRLVAQLKEYEATGSVLPNDKSLFKAFRNTREEIKVLETEIEQLHNKLLTDESRKALRSKRAKLNRLKLNENSSNKLVK